MNQKLLEKSETFLHQNTSSSLESIESRMNDYREQHKQKVKFFFFGGAGGWQSQTSKKFLMSCVLSLLKYYLDKNVGFY